MVFAQQIFVQKDLDLIHPQEEMGEKEREWKEEGEQKKKTKTKYMKRKEKKAKRLDSFQDVFHCQSIT